LQGAAMAFFFIPLQQIVFSGLPPARMPAAAGLSNFVRITAGAFGTSIFTTLWEDRAIMHHAQLAETLHRGNDSATQTLTQLGAAGFTPDQSLAMVNRLVEQLAQPFPVDRPRARAAVELLVVEQGLDDEASGRRLQGPLDRIGGARC